MAQAKSTHLNLKNIMSTKTKHKKQLSRKSKKQQKSKHAAYLKRRNKSQHRKATLEKANALNNQGVVLFKSGQYEATIEKFEQALKVEPFNFRTLFEYGFVLSEVGQYKSASEKFERALQIDPNNIEVLNNCGSAFFNSGDYKTALKKFKNALQIKPDEIMILYNYGTALVENDQYNEAIEQFEKVLQISPNHNKALGNYGVALACLGRYEAAIEKFEKIMTIDPNSQDRVDLLYLFLGVFYYRTKSEIQGNKYFELEIERSDDRDAARIEVAQQIFAEHPYSEKGIAILQEITETSPHYQEAFKSLTLNLSQKAFFEMFRTRSTDDEVLKDTELLNRALYHKIANEIAILKETIHILISGYNITDSGLSDILNSINSILDGIKQRRDLEKAQVKEIPANDYDAVIATISETAHDISDFANNKLAAIEEKIRLMLIKSPKNDLLTKKLHKMLEKIKFSQSALHDFKSVNEGIKIRNSYFEVKELFEHWENTSTFGHATLTLDIRNGESTFYGDKEKLRSFVKELVENSLRHNSDQDDLQIRVMSQDDNNAPHLPQGVFGRSSTFLVITVRDNGKGIPPEKREWVFLPLKTSSKEGSGLGLFIIKRTLKEMHGHILETGAQGAAFKIYIPYL